MQTATCCTPSLVVRRYRTRAERTRWLQAYADELETELEAVRERIADLEAA